MYSHIICMNIIIETVLGSLLMFSRSKKMATSTGVTKLCYFSPGIPWSSGKAHPREVFMQYQPWCL